MTSNTPVPSRIQALLKPQFHQELTIGNIPNLPVEAIVGIGSIYKLIFHRANVLTIEDLSNVPDRISIRKFGIPVRLIDKFWMAARLLGHYVEFGESEEAGRKIVLAGLDRAGKTSIIRSIQSMRPITNTTATLGANIEKIELAGKVIAFWDLGGQARFRNIFTRENSLHLSNLSLLVFVFDIQDPARSSEGLQYLQKILEISIFFDQKPKVVIFFHKFDQTTDPNALTALVQNKHNLLMQIDSILKQFDFPSFISYDTSIYDIPTLVLAFSHTLTSLSPVYSVINGVLEFYGKEHNVLGIFLMSDQGLVISEYVDPLDEKSKGEVLIRALTSIAGGLDTSIYTEQIESGEYITVEQLIVNEFVLYLTTVSEKETEMKKADPKVLHDMLSPWLGNLFASL
ncbi:MAG: ADP-ribosylation factor-like protein [Candidatus Hodarchaeota archaeon]